MYSCIYHGTVDHRRQSPVEHQFRYKLFWLYLDLSEWADVKRRVRGLGDRFLAPAAFYRPDHMGDWAMPLTEAIRRFVSAESGRDLATGPVRLLTQPRSLGFYFSPLNLYYCFNSNEKLEAVVAEVNNTPWGEQHCYLLWQGNKLPAGEGRYRHAKTFHVSPFMAMDQRYAWEVGVPAETLSVRLAAEQGNEAFFDAGMQLARQPLTTWTLASHLARSPVNAARLLGAIYFEAFRLWMKRCPYYPHPKTKSTNASAM